MVEEKIRNWIEKKLEKDIKPERVKESLRNTGHDPSLVDEVTGNKPEEDPFQGDKETGTSDREDKEFEFASNVDHEEEEGENQSEQYFITKNILDRKTAAVLGISLVIAVGMAGVSSYIETSEVFQPQCSGGDEGAGVKVYSVEARNDVTTAEISVVKEVNVVLEVFDSGEKIGQNVEKMDGRGTISVDGVGNRISFHEYGCDEPSIEMNY
ncbi:MAG: hypothetical protein BRC28_00580 [Nanohaloarchaea archaeon SW_4_43_9]|nr:MAG: hypothetical protein BRC28_00580 [Nanohaloarchaea archaeon SW_4_43_9]